MCIYPNGSRNAQFCPGTFDGLKKLEARKNRSVRLLTVAHDLHFVATSGLILTHWRAFIDKLIGNRQHMIASDDNALLQIGNPLHDDDYYDDDHYDDHPDKTDEDAMRQLEDRLSNLVTSQQFDDKQFDDKLSDLATTIANLEKNTVDAAAADREERARLLRVLQDLSTTIGIHGQQ